MNRGDDMDNIVVSKLQTSKQSVKTNEKITIKVYAYSIKPETGGYYLAFRLKAPKVKT